MVLMFEGSKSDAESTEADLFASQSTMGVIRDCMNISPTPCGSGQDSPDRELG